MDVDQEVSRQLGILWNLRDLFLEACHSEQQVGLGQALEPFDVHTWQQDHRDLSSLSGPHTSSSDFRAVFEFICLFRPALLQPLATAAGVEAQQCILARLCDLSCRALTLTG